MRRRRHRGGDDPVPVSEPLTEVGAELGMAAPDALATIQSRWPEIVGADVAPHSRARSLRSGVLRVTVDESAWATQLRYLASQLLDRLDVIVGGGTVTQVRVSVTSEGARKDVEKPR